MSWHLDERDVIRGAVRSGSGHVSKTIVGERLALWSKAAGVNLAPGTLNVRVPSAKHSVRWLGPPLFETDQDGRHGALRWWPVVITVREQRYPAYVVRLVQSGTGFLEIVAAVHFRTIGVQDGDIVTIGRVERLVEESDIFGIPAAEGPAVVSPSVALVIGGADRVWVDVKGLEALIEREWDGVVVAVNDVGCHWAKRLDHWATLHTEKLADWKAARQANGHPSGYVTWSREGKPRKLADRFVHAWMGGSSGMLGVQVAKAAGASRVVLCGIPMEKTPHFAESAVHVASRPWHAADSHWRAWRNNADKLKGWVRSMSGRTRDLLGAPTREWLEGTDGEQQQQQHERNDDVAA